MSTKRNDKIRAYTEYLQDKGYVVQSMEGGAPQGANDCEFDGQYFAEGSKLCINGDCLKCIRRVWTSQGNACVGANGTNC